MLYVNTVQEGNISKVAQKLNSSQPPLSTVSVTDIYDKPLTLYRRWEKIIKKIASEEAINPNIFV